MPSNLANILTASAARAPQRTAAATEQARLSYAQLDAATARVAGLLREKGVEPGDRVGLMMPNVPYFPVIYYGILRAGGIVVPINVLLRAREVGFYLGDSQARLLFAWHGFGEEARGGAEHAGAELISVAPGEFEAMLGQAASAPEVVERAGDDIAVLLYTSGTTGTPKGAELTHDNLRINAEMTGRTLAYLTPDDVVLGALPLFHSFGQTCAMNATLASGATLLLMPRFEPGAALETIDRERVSVFMGVPTMYVAMLHYPEREKFDTSALRLCMSGGSALPVEVLRGFDAAFGAKILEGYGLSETSPVASFNHLDRPRKPGSIGTPIEGVEMKVVDELDRELPTGEVGEIVIRGHNVMKGYWRNPEATAEAMRGGWFHTGDMARVDEEGYFFIVDRKKDMIIRGGYNVYPREVEELIYAEPDVQEVAVVGVPDERLGEEVAAIVVPKPGCTIDPQRLQERLRTDMAAYKYPRIIRVVDELPKGPTGKILKREIRLEEGS